MKTVKNRNLLALLAVIGGNSIFGFSFLFSKIALNLVAPSVLIAVRFTVAFLCLNIIRLIGKTSFSLKGKPKKDILLLAFCQPVVYFIAESYGIKMTSSSFAGIIIALIPIAGILADVVIMRSKIAKSQILCAVISVAGVILTTIGAKDLSSSVIGTLVLLISVIAGALFYVFSKRASAYYSPLERTYVMFGVGSVVYIIMAVIQSANDFPAVISGLSNGSFWISILYLSVVSSVAAFLLLNFGSNYVSVSKATLMANLTTVISILAGIIVLGEEFTFVQAIGAVIIIVSVTIGSIVGNK